MKIIIAPNSILSEKAKAVLKVGKSSLDTIAKMRDALSSAHDPIGVGLAAPQIGKSLQIFIARPNPKAKTLVFINPVIKKRWAAVHLRENSRPAQHLHSSFEQTPVAGQDLARSHSERLEQRATADQRYGPTKLEGCLSLPNIWGEVKREEKIKLSFLDDTGKHRTRTFKGLLATIIQHEIDHLNGVLFTKRVLEQKGKLYRSHKNKQSLRSGELKQSLRSGELKKGEDIFEKLEI